ncbi:hypothetical protein BJ912DRAFT_818614, partial [Pholiota molesta]
DLPLLAKLEDVQQHFIRRMLSVGEKCPTSLLFTETAIVPIRYRRIIYALRYLKYLLQMPKESYVHHALRDSIRLAKEGKQCWIMDIQYVLYSL